MGSFDVRDSVNKRCKDVWGQFEDEGTNTVSCCK